MDLLDKVTSLAKRRGYIFPGSDIYGGLANTWDYGPLGVLLKRNIEQSWWNFFVTSRPEIYGLDTSILMNPRVWESSGHTESFTDALIDCKKCRVRTRADHLIEDNVEDVKVEGQSMEQLAKIINENNLKCPNCGAFDWTEPREFNLLFESHVGIVPENQSKVYLRGETAQGMFVDFKQVLDSISPKLPFGLAQSGLVFRNEITKGRFVYRTLEFHLAEFEYYVEQRQWEKWFEYWKEKVNEWIESLGIDQENTRWRPHTKDELSHYSKRTEDLEYKFPFGFKEWCAVAYRTDFDLKNHMEKSGVDLRYTDPVTNEKFIPHVIEPTFGISRTLMVTLIDSYAEDGKRKILKLDPKIAPYKVAVFPLLRNKPELVEKAREIFDNLVKTGLSVTFDDRGNIGKRYLSQDEVGTPWCITVDFDTLKDDAVTIRDRDSTQQERVGVDKLTEWLASKLV
ncbi:glycine--tRNA ligase [Candidatus Woesebacteria bacterium]|nr:glycine--tRNA ligase [Candidatus Woesebacteria bacterium]